MSHRAAICFFHYFSLTFLWQYHISDGLEKDIIAMITKPMEKAMNTLCFDWKNMAHIIGIFHPTMQLGLLGCYLENKPLSLNTQHK